MSSIKTKISYKMKIQIVIDSNIIYNVVSMISVKPQRYLINYMNKYIRLLVNVN